MTAPVLVDAALLTGLLVVLSGPVPAAVARWSWPSAAPRQGLVLWAAVSWAWVLSLVGLVLTVTLAPLGLPLLPAIAAATTDPAALEQPGTVVAGVVTALLALLTVPAVATLRWARDAHRAAAHRRRLAVVGRWDPEHRALVLPVDSPVAYALPGWGGALVVTTRACLEDLPPAERDAVLAHEHAHVAGRHHLVRSWFAAWRLVALGAPGPRAADRAVETLLEMIADRSASRAAGPAAAVSALYSRCAPRSGAGPWYPQPATLARLRSLHGMPGVPVPLTRVSLPSLAAVLLVVPGLLLGRT